MVKNYETTKLENYKTIDSELRTNYSELFFKEVEDRLIDFIRGFPHGDMAALLYDMQFRALNGLMKAFSYRGRKDEVSFTPDEEGGMIDERKVVSHL